MRSNGGTFVKWNNAGAVCGTRNCTRAIVIRPCDPGISVAPLHRPARFRPRRTSIAAESHSGSRTDPPAATVLTAHMQRHHTCAHMSGPGLESTPNVHTDRKSVEPPRTIGIRGHCPLRAISGGGVLRSTEIRPTLEWCGVSGNLAVSRPLAQSRQRVYCLTHMSVLWVPYIRPKLLRMVHTVSR